MNLDACGNAEIVVGFVTIAEAFEVGVNVRFSLCLQHIAWERFVNRRKSEVRLLFFPGDEEDSVWYLARKGIDLDLGIEILDIVISTQGDDCIFVRQTKL